MCRYTAGLAISQKFTFQKSKKNKKIYDPNCFRRGTAEGVEGSLLLSSVARPCRKLSSHQPFPSLTFEQAKLRARAYHP